MEPGPIFKRAIEAMLAILEAELGYRPQTQIAVDSDGPEWMVKIEMRVRKET